MSKTIRCKMTLNSITRQMGGRYRDVQGEQKWTPEPVTSLEFAPVFSDDPRSENKRFWDATPSGKLEFQCVHREAVEHFEVGQEYYVDISLAQSV